MAKSPAVLFYTSDFLSGVSDLTMEERGQYITLLCAQHQKGDLSEKTIRLLVGSPSKDVLAKFVRLENGSYRNQRMHDEIEKRENFTESRKSNGQLGGRPKASGKPSGYPYGKPNENHMPNLPENENRDENKDEKGVQGEKQSMADLALKVLKAYPTHSKDGRQIQGVTINTQSILIAKIKAHPDFPWIEAATLERQNDFPKDIDNWLKTQPDPIALEHKRSTPPPPPQAQTSGRKKLKELQ